MNPDYTHEIQAPLSSAEYILLVKEIGTTQGYEKFRIPGSLDLDVLEAFLVRFFAEQALRIATNNEERLDQETVDALHNCVDLACEYSYGKGIPDALYVLSHVDRTWNGSRFIPLTENMIDVLFDKLCEPFPITQIQNLIGKEQDGVFWERERQRLYASISLRHVAAINSDRWLATIKKNPDQTEEQMTEMRNAIRRNIFRIAPIMHVMTIQPNLIKLIESLKDKPWSLKDDLRIVAGTMMTAGLTNASRLFGFIEYD